MSSRDECGSRIAESEIKKRGQREKRHRGLYYIDGTLIREGKKRTSLFRFATVSSFIQNFIFYDDIFHDIFTKQRGEERRDGRLSTTTARDVEKGNRGWWNEGGGNVARIETKSGAVAFVRDRFWAEDFPAAARRRVSIRASLNRGSVSF